MSFHKVDASQHNIFLSLAINTFLSNQGGDVLFIDGGVPFMAHQAKVPPILAGYRPDAVISSENRFWIIEVKSFEDLASSHSKDQFIKIAAFMKENENVSLNIYIFGSKGRNVLLPEVFLTWIGTDRLIVKSIPHTLDFQT